MKNVYTILLIFLSVLASAQEYIFGKVSNVDGISLSGVTVVNMQTDERVYTDQFGSFMMKASVGQEIRVMDKGYERKSIWLTQQNFTSAVEIHLVKAVREIPELVIGFAPTGNIKKDTKALNKPEKVVKLNSDLAAYVKTPSTVAYPKNQMPSSIVMGPNFSAGQVDLVKLVGAIVGVVDKNINPKTTANYYEQQEFYRRIKQNVNIQYFESYGIDDYTFEELLVYADNVYNLSKKYRKDFDIKTIESYLKMALKEFMKTRKMSMEPSREEA